MSIRDGGQAFPLPTAYYPNGELLHGGWDGMSLRDYFAAKAMQGMLQRTLAPQEISQVSYIIADAMLAAREE
jgi:hypothetical protein